MASLLSFLLVLMRALPALESLFRKAVEERDKEREREATRRLEAKNTAVDQAIDAPFTPQEQLNVVRDIQEQAGD